MDDAHSELLDVVQPKVSQVMNDGMDAPYTEEEIKKALFQMAPSNSQGLTVLLQVSSSDIGLSLKMMW
jgi:predicted XRE-type DNA-binding protein